MKKKEQNRIPRTDEELLQILKEEIQKLKEFYYLGDKLSLREFLDLRAYMGRTQSGELTDMTKKEVIKKWSNQNGSAHQDWEIEEDIDSFLNSGNMININGLPIHALELRATTKVVLNIADKFLNEIQK